MKKVIRSTDLIFAPNINPDCQVYLKTENLQITGSFKVRGSAYKIAMLSEEEIDGPATVKYVCLPAEYELTLTSEITDLKVTQGAFCCGVLAEYYFQNKVFDLAKSFDTEFRAQMNELKYKGKSIVIKVRRWK